MSGRFGDLSDKQAEKLEQFKEALKDVLEDRHDDLFLLRFLRAREFNVTNAEDMFRKNMDWRKMNNMDNVMKDVVFPEVLTKYFGGGFIGFDKDGAPVYIDLLGTRDIKGLMKSCRKGEMELFMHKFLEQFLVATREQEKKLGRDIHGTVVIFDMEGLGTDFFWKPWMDFQKKETMIMEANYPENAKASIVINAPRIFSVVWAFIKPLLAEETRKKVRIYGSDYKTQLLKFVDADILPAAYGGKRVDPDGDPRCPSVVGLAGPVPESYYIQGQDLSGRALETREVKSISTLEFKYEVGRPGSVISYEFRTKKADIEFSVKKINPDGSKVDIVGKERYNCHISPEENTLTLKEPGVYVVKFDNSYSLTRSKTLSYFVEVLEPISESEDDLTDLLH